MSGVQSEKESKKRQKELRLRKSHANRLGEAILSQHDGVYEQLGYDRDLGHW